MSVLALVLAGALLLTASEGEARRLFKDGQRAEKKGDVVRAYLLYSQASAESPQNREYWLKSQALRIPATLASPPQAQPVTAPAAVPAGGTGEALALEPAALPPIELAASAERKSFDLRGDARSLFTQVARAYGLEAVFDSDYTPGAPVSFRLDDANYREALHALEAVTGSFVSPVSERRLLVVKDTPQKRIEMEQQVSVTIPVPELVSLQDAQELVAAVRTAMALQRLVLDSQRRVIVARDRVSRVRPAQALIEQLLRQRAEVQITVEFVEISSSASTTYGASLQTLYPLLDFGKTWNSITSAPSGFASYLTFGGGTTLLGLGVAGAQAFAQMTRSTGSSLYRTELRSLDGQQATLHVGDRYPILTGKTVGATAGTLGEAQPTINFEDLGLLIKITPHVNGADAVTLEVDAEFTALTGQSFDEVPQLSSRQIQTVVRLGVGERAAIAGLMNSSQARTISGLAGLSRVPLLGPLLSQRTRADSQAQLLLVIQPALLSLPPSQDSLHAVPVGPEQRPPYPL